MKARRWQGLAILAFWLGSLALPVVRMADASQPVVRGWDILTIGWLGLLLLQFGWFGNFAMLAIGVAFSRREPPRRGLMTMLGIVMMLITVDALFWTSIPTDAGDGPIGRYLVGYWVWLASAGYAGVLAISYGRAIVWTVPD